MAFKQIEFNMGPQHPSTHGVLRLMVSADNEVVTKVEPVLGYLHRGMEKLWENRTWPQITPLTDRLDYISAILNNLAYVLAAEKLLGAEIPKRAQYIRVILAELQRLASHLAWIGFNANDLGAASVLLYGFAEREPIMEIFEEYCGARLTVHAMRIGGVANDLTPGTVAMIRESLKNIPRRIKDIEGLLTNNRIWRHRTVGVGVLGAEESIAMGVTGPCLRAAGVRWDMRKVLPYSSYDDFDFEIPLGKNGDVYDRYLVRLAEVHQSIRIIEQALDGLPEGDIRAKLPKMLKLPAGEVFHSIEAAKGELGFYILSNGGDKPERMKMKSPSFINMGSLDRMCRGNLIADIVAVLGSLDILLGEIDK
jgi:NADH-quinone oxidoreductase subunit D